VREVGRIVDLADRLALNARIGVECQSDALSDVVFQVSAGKLHLEVVKKDGDKRTSEKVDEVVVSADISASKETIGASKLGSGSLLRVEDLAIVIRAELESGAGELNIPARNSHQEVLVSADLSELQLEFLSCLVYASLGGTSRLDCEAVSLLNGNLRASLVDEIDLESPTIFSDVVGLVALNVKSHQLSLALVDANALVLNNGLPHTSGSTSLLIESEVEVMVDGLRGQIKTTVHKGFHRLNVQNLVLGSRGNFERKFNLDRGSIVEPLGTIIG
jgi:hypothetical protein